MRAWIVLVATGNHVVLVAWSTVHKGTRYWGSIAFTSFRDLDPVILMSRILSERANVLALVTAL